MYLWDRYGELPPRDEPISTPLPIFACTRRETILQRFSSPQLRLPAPSAVDVPVRERPGELRGERQTLGDLPVGRRPARLPDGGASAAAGRQPAEAAPEAGDGQRGAPAAGEVHVQREAERHLRPEGLVQLALWGRAAEFLSLMGRGSVCVCIYSSC